MEAFNDLYFSFSKATEAEGWSNLKAGGAYENWIQENVLKFYGKCAEITMSMVKVFPELRRVRGHYDCPIWGMREHFWLIDDDGNIVDPTLKQFPSAGIGNYIEWDDRKKEPSGKCVNCGGYAYNYEAFCCDKCRISDKHFKTIWITRSLEVDK